MLSVATSPLNFGKERQSMKSLPSKVSVKQSRGELVQSSKEEVKSIIKLNVNYDTR